MKRFSYTLNFVLLFMVSLNAWSANPAPRKRLLMDYNWKFIKSDVKEAEKLKRATLNGLALAVIQSALKSGNIRLTAVFEGLKSATINVISNKAVNGFATVESLK